MAPGRSVSAPTCIYCGRDAGAYDEHDACRERAIAADDLEPDDDPLADPEAPPAPDPDSLFERETDR
jgi:hypothetical protein